ncbi:MAG TPA: hypothetical protein VF177_19375 [Anaerolineae bacterium]
MAPYLQLDPKSVTIDTQLAHRVPYALSRYYLALPLGQDNGYVSVAMAYPDNAKARQILGRLLQAKVVPVFTPAESLQAVLESTHRPVNRESHYILAWYGHPKWQKAVTTAAMMLGDTFQAKVTALATSESDLDETLSHAATSQYELAVIPLPVNPALSTILNQAATPLYFVRGEQQAIRRILVVMRGLASDARALDWLTPFAWRHQAMMTLMPLTDGLDLGLSQYHHRESPAGQHLDRCLRRLHADGVPVDLKFRQGNAIQQVVEEVSGDAYDLLAIAAEAEGSFVSQVITAVEHHNVHHGRPIFVLKPPELPRQ